PSTLTASVGDMILTNVSVTLAPEDAGSLLGAFALTVNWDPALLSLADTTFDIYLDAPDSLQDVSPGTGTVTVSETSFGALTNQTSPGTFRLFQLALTALQPGSTPLTFGDALLSDEIGGDLAATRGASPLITITSVATVPLPAAGWLLFSGLAF